MRKRTLILIKLILLLTFLSSLTATQSVNELLMDLTTEYIIGNDIENTLQKTKTLISDYPSEMMFYLIGSEICYNLELHEEGIDILTEGLANSSKSDKIQFYRRRLILYEIMDRKEDVASEWKNLQQLELYDLGDSLLIARIYAHMKEFDYAKGLFTLLAKGENANSEMKGDRDFANLFYQLGDYMSAINEYDRIIEFYTEVHDVVPIVPHLMKALCYYKLNEYDKSESNLRIAIKNILQYKLNNDSSPEELMKLYDGDFSEIEANDIRILQDSTQPNGRISIDNYESIMELMSFFVSQE